MSEVARVLSTDEPAELIYLLGLNPKQIALIEKDDHGHRLLNDLMGGETLSLELSSGRRVRVLVTDLVQGQSIICKGIVQS
ncbi:MAG TPA: hypothetical protein VMT46_06350 [Anaerolineaceae bacterium]|nr:hypothetical protein [Anaerolineaceae bacterium]